MEKNLFQNNEPIFSYTVIQKPTPAIIASSHLHHSYELLLFYDGDADFNVGGTLYRMRKNDILLIPPSTYHNIVLHSSHPYERVVCNFYSEHIPKNLLPTLKNLHGCSYHAEDGSPILSIFESMIHSRAILNDSDFLYFYKHAIAMLLLHLKNIDNVPVVEKHTMHSTIQKIIYYIDKNPMNPLSLAELSKTFYLSESHISHLFKNHLNTSAMQYINRKKIEYAQSLIESGMPPAQVAESCSYESYATFYRQYKKYLGVAPMQHFIK